MLRRLVLTTATAALLAASGCSDQRAPDRHGHSATAPAPAAAATPMDAIAVIHPTQGNACAGVVRFHQEGGRVRITGTITGLTANGRHAFHIHEYGDASAPDAASAGGHYNPEGHQHGGLDSPMRHAGDFGNLVANGEGTATIDLSVDNITVAGPKNPIIGHAVIVHAQMDDLKSQPSGNAGARIGCGVIGIAKGG